MTDDQTKEPTDANIVNDSAAEVSQQSVAEGSADDKDSFKGGLAILGVGIFVLSGGYPLFQAMTGAEEISVSPKFIGGSLALIAFGMLECLNIQVIRDDENIRPRDIILMILIGIAGFVAYLGYKKLIESYGSTFPSF